MSSPEFDTSPLVSQRAMVREFLGNWEPTESRCDVTSLDGTHCPEVAKYEIVGGSATKVFRAKVCDRCLPAWTDQMTKRGDITVRRLT